MRPVLLVIGTRPEGIKMAPVYFALKQAGIPTILCATSQHDLLLSEVFSVFGITPDIDLKIMKDGQDLFHITATVLLKLKEIITHHQPSLILVQGDTTTTLATGLAAFYTKTPIGHVEAGLRTGDVYAPYPEEFNRVALSLITHYHFAPTSYAMSNLLAEGKQREKVFCVGNTIVDALRLIEEKITHKSVMPNNALIQFFENAKKQGARTLLFTMHRRESFGEPIKALCFELAQYVQQNPWVHVLFPYHPNPHVLEAIEQSKLSHAANITCMPAISYVNVVYSLLQSDVIATDSGGIQEEAISLGKKVIVLREKTERMEGVWEGLATIVGYNSNFFTKTLNQYFLETPYTSAKNHIYGDGHAATRIVSIIKNKTYEHTHLISPATAYEQPRENLQ